MKYKTDTRYNEVSCNVARAFYHKWMQEGYKHNIYPTYTMMHEPVWNPKNTYVITEYKSGEYTLWSIYTEDMTLVEPDNVDDALFEEILREEEHKLFY